MKSSHNISSAASYRHKCVKRPSLIPCSCPAGHWTITIWSDSSSSIESHLCWTKSEYKIGNLCWLQALYKSTDRIWTSIKLNRRNLDLACHEPAAERQAIRMCVQKLWINVRITMSSNSIWHHTPRMPEEPSDQVSCIIVLKPGNVRTVKWQPEIPQCLESTSAEINRKFSERYK